MPLDDEFKCVERGGIVAVKANFAERDGVAEDHDSLNDGDVPFFLWAEFRVVVDGNHLLHCSVNDPQGRFFTIIRCDDSSYSAALNVVLGHDINFLESIGLGGELSEACQPYKTIYREGADNFGHGQRVFSDFT